MTTMTYDSYVIQWQLGTLITERKMKYIYFLKIFIILKITSLFHFLFND